MAAKRSLEKRLAAKVGPLPVWGWAAVIFGAYLLYSRLHGAATGMAATQPASTATTGDSGSGAQVPASGQGGAGDNYNGPLLDQLGANQSSIDALTSAILSASSPYYSYGDAPAAGMPVTAGSAGTSSYQPPPAPAAAPTAPPTTAARTGAPPAAHPTQNTAGVLSWDGLDFTTRASFDSWARAHGTSSAAIFSKHPQAKAIYSTLR